MIVYIQGADSYLAKQAIDQLKTKYLAKNDGAELIEINPEDAQPDFAGLAAVPLFATSRLVVVKGAGLFDATVQDKLAIALSGLPETTVAVIWDQKILPPQSALFTVMDKATKKILANPLKDLALRRWVQSRAAELSVELEPDTVTNLLSAGGNDLWFIETELRYLATATGEQNANTHQKIQKPDDYFVYFRLVRQRAWKKISAQLTADFRIGTPFELLLGSLAAAIRKEVSDKKERMKLIELMGDIDFGAKTGLIDPSEAIALLAHHLPNPAQERVQWEVMWEGVV